jgi:histone H2A
MVRAAATRKPTTSAKAPPKTSKKRVSGSARAGLVFPVGRIGTKLKNAVPWRVTKSAAAYLAATLEFLASELLDLSGNAAKDLKVKRIMPRHIQYALAGDQEFTILTQGRTIGGSGRLAEQRDFSKEEMQKWKMGILTPNS